ncbi:HtaA domain-containing protein [Agromyces soli]|uniref:HtaA domain-containing protein n=1 Tax=Agromyces soli TaxID=659012 RepID=A0ABY4AZG9_9MICO|nr:HtaA domain-containing protein [Agromyces soli]UOE27511.1 HtaA domain-containing protein [Agromyces soli]
MKTPSPTTARPATRAGTVTRWLASGLAALLVAGGSLMSAGPALAEDASPSPAPLVAEAPLAPADSSDEGDVAGSGSPEASPASEAPAAEPAPTPETAPVAETPAAPAEPATPSPAAKAADAPAPAPLVAAAPQLTISPATNVDPAVQNVFTVTGSGFVGEGAKNGAYLLIGETGIWAGEGPLVSEGWLAQSWVMPREIVDGAFTKSITIAAGKFDPAKTYTVASSAAHELSATDRSLDAFAPITVKQPVVSVSKTTGLDAAGEVVTVSGTGFSPVSPSTDGTRPPLAGKFGGAYVVFGSFLDAWKPSAGEPASARVVDSQKWVVNPEDVATIGGAARGAVAIEADGSFRVELTVREFEKALADGNYGIYTYSGGGAKHAGFETFTPIAFAAAPATPVVSVSKTTGLDAAGEVVTVSGTGFSPVSPSTDGTRPPLAGKFGGAYVVFGSFLDAWKPSAGEPAAARVVDSQKWVVNPEDVATIGGAARGAVAIEADGSFRVELTVREFEKALADGNYGIYTYSGGGAKHAGFETFTPIAFAAAPQPVKPTLTVTPSTDVDASLAQTFTVTGTGYTGAGAAQGVYVLLGDASIWTGDGPLVADGWTVQTWVKPNEIVDGAFSIQLKTAARALDPAKRYTVASSAAHALSATDRSLDAFAPIAVKAGAAKPTLTVSPATNVDPAAAQTFTVTGTGYVGDGAAQGVYVLLGDASIWTGDGPLVADGWTALDWVMPNQIVDGRFTVQLKVPAKSFDPAKRYTVATSAAHGLSVFNRTMDAFAPITLKADAPNPKLAVSPSTDVDASKAQTFTVRGTGYTGAGAAQGVYVLLGDASIWTGTGPLVADGWTALAWVKPGEIVNGAFSIELKVPAGKLDAKKRYTVASSAAHGLSVTDRSLDAFTPITVKGGTKPPVDPKPPVNPTKPGTTNPVSSGSLSWGIADAFRSYVVGPIARGSITVGSGATQAGSAFQFGQSGGSYTAARGTGTADYSGSVRFIGHGGILDLTFSNPTLRVTSATTGVLELTANGSRIDFATVDLGAAAKSSVGGATRFAGAPATLTAAGADAFQGYYGSGKALDPITVVIGSPGAAPAGSSGTTASATPASAATPVPLTPPATTGIQLAPAVLADLVAGKPVTISVDGFEPNETGIMVVVYSTPTVLAENLTADANGVVTWTGSLPAGLEPGQHTLTFQGSISKGVVFTVAAAANQCLVTEGSLDWGFKASFLQYLESGIANGTWTVTGASEQDGRFAFTGGTGPIDAKTLRGVVAFPGSVEFTGHDGALDTTIANPKLEFVSAEEAYLLLDVTGTTQDGAPVEAKGVRFAELELSGLAVDGTMLAASDVPAVLTEQGAAAFGTYAAGEELDPVTFSLTLPADCGVAAPAVAAEDGGEVQRTDAGSTEVAETAGVSPWLIWGGVALLLLIAAVVLVVLLRRRAAGRTEA